MTKVYFQNGKYGFKEGRGLVNVSGIKSENLNLGRDDFLLYGNGSGMHSIFLFNASLDAKDATIKSLKVDLFRSKAENVNANWIWLWDNSSISNSSANELMTARGNNTVDSVVSAKVLKFYKDATLTIAKDGVLKVPDKNALDFSKISGEGKIYAEKQHAYYDTNNKILEYEKNIDLSTLNNGDGDEAFSFDGTKLVLNKGYEFSLSGDKPAFITNNATILKADINGTKLMSISGSGSIKELHLSNNARFSLNGDFKKAVIENGSVLSLYKQIDFKNLSGDGYVNINGAIYDTNGHALNNANDLFQTNIINHNFAVAKATEKVKDKMDIYIDGHEHQKYDVDLLNIEMINNDNFL